MTLPLVLLNRRRIGGFNPRAILAGSTAFLWLDPSDLTTMFQDAAGTTPVTAPAQPVGRILDKSGNGFHATQSTAANRPTYGVVPSRGRVNLLTFTEDFSNAAWNKGNTTVTAPDANGWIRLQASTTASILVSQTANGAGSASGNTFTIQVKKGSGATDANRFGFRNNTTATDLILVTFNYDTGVVSGTGASDVTVTAGANAGEWTLQLRPSSGISAGNNLVVYTCFVGATEASTEFAFVRYPQLELGTASPYQRVASQFDVTDPAGFPSYPLHYLFFGGDLDPRWLQTSTITPNADKVQVFAGVRKLSDAALGVVVESSVASNANNGTTALFAPHAASNPTYSFRSRGTSQGVPNSPSTFAAPITNVVSGLGDISGDLATLRVNGTQVAQSTDDQGTGNFLAYQLFIGRRGGTSTALNGQLYGLIVRFSTANLDASVISQTERWLAQKTGVTI